MIKKIRTKLILLIAVTGLTSLLLFHGLWTQKWPFWHWLIENCPIEFSLLPEPEEDIFSRLSEEAQKYEAPESEDDAEGVEAIQPFFDLADKYTAIYIYGIEDGMYRAGRAPSAFIENRDNYFFNMSYEWTDGIVERFHSVNLKFKNGYASVMIYLYHSMFFIVPYLIFCLTVCILWFLAVILYFVTGKMRVVERLKGEILEMASGNLDTPVKEEGQDELGVLAKELDSLRITLNEKFADEQELHKSNQELIAALSHDLRTPLTILKGYLEIVQLGRNQEQQEEYVRRCIRKTEDIQEMTNRMFEYALVYDEVKLEKDYPELERVMQSMILKELKEHMEFLELAGFQTELVNDLPEKEEETVLADTAMLKRVFNNLFSNIIKYADKKTPIHIEVTSEPEFCILIKNRIKAEQNPIESNRIGLKSVRKIMEFMDGDVEVTEENREFAVRLRMKII